MIETRARFLVQRHSTGRGHFDLRLIQDEQVRSWSMLKEPPSRPGQRRLAIEQESLSVDAIRGPIIEEDAFGAGRARLWDSGEVVVRTVTPQQIILVFMGKQLAGTYRLRRMRWYPGNRWLLERSRSPSSDST